MAFGSKEPVIGSVAYKNSVSRFRNSAALDMLCLTFFGRGIDSNSLPVTASNPVKNERFKTRPAKRFGTPDCERSSCRQPRKKLINS